MPRLGRTIAITDSSASESAELRVKKGRQGKPKARTGCITCKIRRIKCDEAKPACLKCKSTGRKCDGYLPVPESKSKSKSNSNRASPTTSTSTSPASHVTESFIEEVDFSSAVVQIPHESFLDFQGTTVEQRYLDFFRHRTAPVLSGFFDSNFWDSLLPLVAYSEETLQHALVAVAAIHEHTENRGLDLFSRFEHGPQKKSQVRLFVINQYNQAISSLVHRLSQGPSEEVTLMCCVLFICLEFLRGNIGAAIAHCQSGTKVLLGWRERMGQSNADEVLDLSTDMISIAGNLTQIFSRLTIQAYLCGRPPPTQRSDPPTTVEIPLCFTTLQEARACLDHIMKVTLRFLRECGEYSYEPPSIERDAMEIRKTLLGTNLNKWARAFDAFLLTNSIRISKKDMRACKILQIQNIVACTWLDHALVCSETGFDSKMEEFERILKMATDLVNTQPANLPRKTTSTADPTTFNTTEEGKSASFQFEMGLIPPLYFVATKCRHPLLRRRALALLSRTTPRREGLWDANLSAAVAARVIEIEEECLGALRGFAGWDRSVEDMGSVEDESTFALMADVRPPERYRVHDSIMHESTEEDVDAQRQRISLLLQPEGRDGGFCLWDEVVMWVGGKRSWSMAPNNSRRIVSKSAVYKLRRRRFGTGPTIDDYENYDDDVVALCGAKGGWGDGGGYK